MTCRCGALMELDGEFLRDAVAYHGAFNRQRWVCVRGHSTYTNLQWTETCPRHSSEPLPCLICAPMPRYQRDTDHGRSDALAGKLGAPMRCRVCHAVFSRDNPKAAYCPACRRASRRCWYCKYRIGHSRNCRRQTYKHDALLANA